MFHEPRNFSIELADMKVKVLDFSKHVLLINSWSFDGVETIVPETTWVAPMKVMISNAANSGPLMMT